MPSGRGHIRNIMGLLLNVLIFLIGLLLLVFSADYFIQASVRISRIFKLSPLFIGLVIVAFGTSAPEAGVSIVAAFKGQGSISLGNIIGSNIANIGLILGICGMLFPLTVRKEVIRRQLPLMLIAMLIFYLLCLDLVIGRVDSIILLLCFSLFIFLSFKGARSQKDVDEGNFEINKIFERISSKAAIFLITILSLFGLVLGADLMVRGGVKLAKIFSINPWIIGITVFAIGTSLPELAASLSASFKGAHSLSLGNVIGSNIFNVLFVLGIASFIRPIYLELSMVRFEIPIMILFSFLLFTVMRTEYKITRWEGLLLFIGYIGFLTFLILRS
ncbi:MAG: calcium/sodium antiporter [Candidatus Omnitrophota bacterium]